MSFTARYDGTCNECQLEITAGEDELVKYDDEYIHERCAQRLEMEARRARRPICPVCNLQEPCEHSDANGMARLNSAAGESATSAAASAARLAKMAASRPAPAPMPTGQDAIEAFFQDNPVPYTTLEEQVEAKVERDQWDRPKIIQPDGGTEPYNRASSYGGQLDDKKNVEKWDRRQVVRGIAIALRSNPGFLSSVPERLFDPWNDQEPKEKDILNSLADQAKDMAGSNLKSQLGTDIHYATELVDLGDELESKLSIFEPWRKDLLIERANAYYKVTQELGLKWDSVEVFGVQDDLKVAGTWDRRGFVPWWPEHQQTIGDVKTSSSMDYAGLTFAVQLATYSRMSEYVIETGERIPHGDMNVKKALIIHVDRMKGGPVEPFEVDIEWGWRKAGYAREIIIARREGGAKGKNAKVQRIDEREAAILTCTTRTELRELADEAASWPTWLRMVARQRWNDIPIEEE